MFDNCGKKLKVLAYVIFGLDALAGVIYGFSLMMEDFVLSGILLIVIAPLLGWLSSIVLYTIGDIWEGLSNVCYFLRESNASRQINGESQQTSSSNTPVYYNNAPVADSWTCPKCGAKCNTRECDECGYRKQ